MGKHKQRAIDSLVQDMISMFPQDAQVKKARSALAARDPRAVERIAPYDPVRRANIFQFIEPLRDKSPLTPEQLLQSDPSAIIRQLLDFNETQWGEINRDGMISAICSAADQNAQWAFKLFAALLEQGVKDNDIWRRVLWKLKWAKLTTVQQEWLLDSIDPAYKYHEDFLSGFAQLVLVHGIPASEEQIDPSILKKQLQLTFWLWQRTQGRRGWKVKQPYSHNDWIFEAINRPPGHCCVFWLKYTELLQKDQKGGSRTWPEEIAPYMNQIIEADTRGQLLGLALLGQYLSQTRFLAPEWTKQRLYPCLDFRKRRNKAFPLWLGFSGYGWLSRELAQEA